MKVVVLKDADFQEIYQRLKAAQVDLAERHPGQKATIDAAYRSMMFHLVSWAGKHGFEKVGE